MEYSSIRQRLFDTQSAQMEEVRPCQAPSETESSSSAGNPIISENVSTYNSTESDCTTEGSNRCCDINCDSDNSFSVSECGTPQEAELTCLSDSPTPIGNDPGPLDPAQIMLRLFLRAARSGDSDLPEWDGLGEALRVYFAEGWHKDSYSKEEAERRKEFLFWNAVSEEKWRVTENGY